MPHSSIVFSALVLCCAGAAAQAPVPLQESVHFFTYENDTWFDTDRYYTSGVQFSVKHSRDKRGDFARSWTEPLCRWLHCLDAPLLTSHSNLGQLIYTPGDITTPAPQPQDRPWAGLLYYEQVYAFLARDQRTLTTLSAQIGVTGPASLAEPAQKLLHRVLDRPRPLGWHNQTGGSLGVLVSAERRSALDAFSFELPGAVRLNTASYWRIAAGNIATYAAGGVAIVIGKDLPPVSPPPPGIGNKMNDSADRKASVVTTCLAAWLQCTGFASAEARLVAYNVFLDGRLGRDDPDVTRRAFVYELVTGLRLDLPRSRSASHGPWFAQFKVSRRSREFRSPLPPPRHYIGAFTIGTEF